MPGENGGAAQRLVALRAAPLLLFSLLFGTALVVANPGLFWDDWVWVHQSSADNLQIAKELGVWWVGYLTNAIWAAPDPVLLMRVVALAAWAIGSAAFARTMWRRGWIDSGEAMLIVALLVSAHVCHVRFVNSVAMYNVYIACFWLACAILAHEPRGRPSRLVAAALFFVSFHLNSMLVMYGLFLVWLFTCHARDEIRRRSLLAEGSGAGEGPGLSPAGLRRGVGFDWRNSRSRAAAREMANAVIAQAIAAMLKRDWLFCVVPFLFFATVKLASLALSTVLSSQQRIYSDYNAVRPDRLIAELLSIPGAFVGNLAAYFQLALSVAPLRVIGPFMLAGAALALLLPWSGRLPGLRRTAAQLVGGFAIFAAGVYPYFVVGKPPVVDDFYEARNIMPALAGLAMVFLGCANAGALLLRPILPSLMIVGRNVALGAVVGMAVGAQCLLGLELARDWLRQEAIMRYVAAKQKDLDRYSTYLFVDHSEGFRILKRQIWNYEYTGALVQVLGRRTKLGIGVDEYEGWRVPSPLIQDPVFRRRYNLADYDPRGPQAVIEIGGSERRPSARALVELLADHRLGRDIGERALGYLRIAHAEQLLLADRQIDRLRRIAAALETYKAETGLYPHTTPVPPLSREGRAPVPVRLPGPRPVPELLNKVPGLAPRHGLDCLPREDGEADAGDVCRVEPACLSEGCGLLFMSDGLDYKLILHRPVDLAYARQAYPDLIDPVRSGYGLWTLGAARW